MTDGADVYQELEWHRIATRRAIETGNVPMAKRRLDSYVLFSETFLRELDSRGLRLSREQARSVSYLDWPFAVQIVEHIHEAVIAALDTGNREMITAVLFQPVEFMKISVRIADFLFFRRMLRIYPMALARSYYLPSADASSLVVDRSWRYLREFAELAFPRLSQGLDQPTAAMFLSDIIWTFSDLLKVTVDQSDVDNYREIGRELDRLSGRLSYETKMPQHDRDVPQEPTKLRQLVWFGLGSWLVRAHAIAPTEAVFQEVKQTVSPLHLPALLQPVTEKYSTIRQLSQVYIDALQFEDIRMWGYWILEGLSEGEVHSIDFSRWLTYFYCIQGIKLSPPSDSVVADMPITDKHLKYKLDDIRSVCEAIHNSPSKWERIVTKEQMENWKSFVELNEEAVALYELHRQDTIIQSPLSGTRLTLYKEEFSKGWNSDAWLDCLLRSHARVIRQAAGEDNSYVALHFRMPKEAFIDAQEARWIGFGSEHGRQLARGVTSQYVDKLLETTESAITQSSVSELPQLLSSHLNDMIEAGLSPHIVVIIGDHHLEEQLIRNNALVAKWSPMCPSLGLDYGDYLGVIRGTPVFREGRTNQSSILLANLEMIGEYVIYEPQRDAYQDFLIRIRLLYESELEQLIEGEIEESRRGGQPQLSRDDIVRLLKQGVEVFAGFRAELRIARPDCVRRIDVA